MRPLAGYWSIACIAALVGACSLFVDLDGLSGGTSATLDDGGSAGADGSAIADATAGDATANDAATSSKYASTVLADAPIAYWRLGDAVAPVAANMISGAPNGTYTGGVILGIPGAIANDPDTAAEFDGNDYVTISAPAGFDFAGGATFSIEAWFKRTSTGEGILGKEFYDAGYYGWMLVYNGANLNFWRGGQEISIASPADGAFFHAVATFDGVTLLLFINGVQVGANGTSSALKATGVPILFGTVPQWGDTTGVLDEVAIYDKALPPARVLAHYQAGMGK